MGRPANPNNPSAGREECSARRCNVSIWFLILTNLIVFQLTYNLKNVSVASRLLELGAVDSNAPIEVLQSTSSSTTGTFNNERHTDSDGDGDPCHGYDGVLHVRMGDMGAAAGTVFFIYVINHLIYAEMYNLLPWIHLDGTSHRIYDSHVHGGDNRTRVELEMIRMDIRNGDRDIPHPPQPPTADTQKEVMEVQGNGVWESYFEPVSTFSPFTNRTCKTANKPLYEIDYDGVAGGMHLEAEWAIRAWVYGTVPKADRQLVLRDWYRPMRQRGASFVRRYIWPKPWLQKAANQANPLRPGQQCVAVHVRRTDKVLSGGRVEIELKEYLPHVQAFLGKAGANAIVYLATDSSQTLRDIHSQWPQEIVNRIRNQEHAIRSESSRPVFDLAQASHHRTNTEVLTDIYAMAKCSILIHGRSSVSEAVLYINPDIRESSIDVEYDQQTVEDLGYWH